MSSQSPEPGVSRHDRISAEGLRRLKQQLETGARISAPVLAQWIRRYGEPARQLIREYGRYSPDLDAE